MLSINELTFRYGGRAIFDKAGVSIPAGHRVGLIGRNGSGKSTLLKLILNELQPDSGSLEMPSRARVGHLAQEAPAGALSLVEFVLEADLERAALLKEADTAEDPSRIAEIHDRLLTIEAHAAPSRAATILSGLGFDHEAQQRPVSDFSGGWRMRVALAAVLFSGPDLMLLDEPSNHLDLEARIWLEQFLVQFPGTLILVSHDRDLLNAVVEEVVLVDGGKLTMYRGNYDTFEKTRAEQANLHAAAVVKNRARRKHLQAFVDRFRYKASKARQAQSRIKMLEKMGEVVPLAPPEEITFEFPDPEEMPPPIVAIEDAAIGYAEGKPILRKLGLRIDMDDRIALLGQNGNGKSTLLKLLANKLQPQSGSIRRSQKLRVGYYDQDQTQAFDMERTPFHHLQAIMPQAPEHKVRAQLGRFGFAQDRANRKVGQLSGGERARLLFALTTHDAPHLLLLDEPTNHLDIEARDALVAALSAFQGAVILVSHDPRMVSATADRLWLVADGGCKQFDGDIADYKKHLQDERKSAQRAEKQGEKKKKDKDVSAKPAVTLADAPRMKSAEAQKEERRVAAEARHQLKPLRQALTAAEKVVDRLTKEKATIEAKLADPKLYEGPPAEVTKLQRDLGHVAHSLAQAEDEWLTAHEAYEDAAKIAG